MQGVNCNICDLDNSYKLVTKNSFNVVRCRNCGLIYVNPRPAEDQLKEVYFFEGRYGRQHHVKEKRFNRILQYIGRLGQDKGRLLDVGCSKGIFLRLAQKYGWEVCGIDVDKEALEYAKRNFGLNVSEATITDNIFQERSFDVIAMLDSIEHMPDPLKALKNANKILKEGGILILRTPNADGLFPRITYFCFAKTFGFWEHPSPPKHIYQFSIETIKKILDKSGFRIVTIILDEIFIKSTIKELEEEMANFLKRILSGGNGTINSQSQMNVSSSFAKEAGNSSGERSSLSKRIFRTVLHSISFSLVHSIYPLARLLNKGDSMIVIARKGTATLQ